MTSKIRRLSYYRQPKTTDKSHTLLTMWAAKMFLKKKSSKLSENPLLINVFKDIMDQYSPMARQDQERLTLSKEEDMNRAQVKAKKKGNKEDYFQDALNTYSIKLLR